MPAHNTNNDQKSRTKLYNELWKGKSEHTQYKETIKEPGLLDRWPKFLDLQARLPDPGGPAALVEMRKMCAGKAATLEEMEEACRETAFHNPFWNGKTATTDITERILSPAEVEVINNTYMELNAAFLAKLQGQDAGEAIAEAEQNRTVQSLKAQELLVKFRREMQIGNGELNGMVHKKKKKSAEGYFYIKAQDGAYYKHESSGYYNEVRDLDVTERFDKVSIVNKNNDGAWAYRCKYGIIKATSA